jgi:cytochrome c5
MKTLETTFKNLITLSLFCLLAAASAHGQAGLNATVPFDFEAGGKSLPAGQYQFKMPAHEQLLEISNGSTMVARLHIITQLGRTSFSQDAGLVFDNLEGHHILSEVWMPGQDGLLVHATPKQHTHEMVLAMGSAATANLSGKAVFERTCARCHGANGKGNPAADRFFQTQIPRLDSAFVQSKSDGELKDIVGHGKNKMDPVRMGQAEVQHLLDPRSVDAVISFLRSLKQP